MKRLIAAIFAIALVLPIVPDAEAMRRTGICFIDYGDDGQVCKEDCTYMDEDGHVTGRVIVDYHC